MGQFISKLGPTLTRVFKTNWLTTAGGLLSLAGVVFLLLHLIDKETALECIGGGGTLAGLGAKDGLRDAPTVANESLSAPDVAAGGPPVGVVVLLLFWGLATLTACAGAKSPPPPLDTVSAALLAPQLLPGQPATAPPDTLPAAPVPPYLVAPPAGLSPRQVRQFRRAQRRALVEASRQAPYKVKQGAGSAYAPDGTAVALRKPDGPVGVGPGAAVTDNANVGRNANGGVGAAGADWSGTATGATTPKPPTLWQRLVDGFNRFWPWLVVVGCAWLAFIPIGPGGLLLPVLGAVFRRRSNTA